MSLLQQNLSNLEIRQLFQCGNSRISKVRKIMEQPALLNNPRPKPHHAVVQDDLDALERHLMTFETEDGFPCAHRRLRKFFIVQGLTWTKVWQSYKSFMLDTDPSARVLSRGRWREYVRAIFPGLRLARSKSDLCDRCVKIDVELNTPGLSQERKDSLKFGEKLHSNSLVTRGEQLSSKCLFGRGVVLFRIYCG